MLKYDICKVTTYQKDHLCTNLQCLLKSSKASIDCYKCLVDKHQHNQQEFYHIQKLPEILKQSIKNIEVATIKLEEMLKQTKNYPELIKNNFGVLQREFQSIFTKMESLVLDRIKSLTTKILLAQQNLQQMIPKLTDEGEYQLNDYEYEEQWKNLTIFAISNQENILPNLNILNFDIKDIQDLLNILKSQIENIYKSNNQFIENQQEKIQLSLNNLLEIKYCPHHENQLKEYLCTNCRDDLVGCRLCMIEQKHRNHHLQKQAEYKEFQATNQSMEQQITKSQLETQKNWNNFIETLKQNLEQKLKNSFQYQLNTTFELLQNCSTKDSLLFSNIQENLRSTQQSILNQIQQKLNIFILEILQFNHEQLSQVKVENSNISDNVLINKIEMDRHYKEIKIDFNFEKYRLAKLIDQKKQHLLGIIDNTNTKQFKHIFRFQNQSDYHGIYGDDDENFILGTQSNHVKFEKKGILFSLKYIVINNRMQDMNQNNQYMWKLFQVQQV